MSINPRLRELDDDGPLPALSPDEGQQILDGMVHECEADGASYHIENGHILADNILLAVLLHLGHSEIVRLYERLPKFYA